MKPEPSRTFVVRIARPEDADRLASLCDQLGYPTLPSDVVERLGNVQTDESVVYVAETSTGEVIGWVHAYVSRLMVCDRFVEIGGLVVDVNHRRNGAGQLLMQAAERWACENGCDEIRLRSNIVRESAHRFYTALGYQVIKTSYTFHKKL